MFWSRKKKETKDRAERKALRRERCLERVRQIRARRQAHRARILARQEARRQSPKWQARIAFLNKYSLLFHILLACGVCFVIEWVSRHSFLSACSFVLDRNLVFLYNSLIVFASLMLVYTVKRRALMRMVISVFWLFLGTINGCVLAKRVSPFSFTDLKMVGDLFTMQSNYFSVTEAAIVVAGVAAVLLFLVLVWFRGPKYQGRIHRIAGLAATVAVVMMLPTVTDAAVSNHILTDYFENLAQGYKDYGFVYSFSSSVLDRGMSAPDDYSEEAVAAVLAKIGGPEATRSAVARVSSDDSQVEARMIAEIGGLTERMETVGGSGSDLAQAAAKDDKADTVCGIVRQQSQRTAAAGEEPAGQNLAEQDMAADEELDGQDLTDPEAGSEKVNTEKGTNEIPGDEGDASGEYPNIICVLLESFIDPELINFLELSDEVAPNFHYLYDNFTSGYLEVPVVGAGTANTEFEVLTGMGMQFFGLGEYPYKTILKQTNCESIASDLHTLGYGTHVVHNNGGNFYSRANAFSMMGFDTFTSKELMDIHEYTPLGTWPTDDILLGEVEKSLDYTPDQPDFVYTITVEGHGDYPKYQVLEDPAITVSGVEDEGMAYAWEYYVNQLHEVDDFIGRLIELLEARDEKTVVVMFGDHLPTMGLTEEDMRTHSLFKTQYVTWNNFGMEKHDKNMTSYQLLADLLDDLGIHTGTMFTFHQNREKYLTQEEYQNAMELLQYDILYGDHYVYGGENPYPASDLIMGTQEVVISQIMETDDWYYIIGDNFTKWSRAFVNEEKVSTEYLSGKLLRVKRGKVPEGVSTLVVNQMGSSDTIFRSSNEVRIEKEPEETETE